MYIYAHKNEPTSMPTLINAHVHLLYAHKM